MTNTKILEIIIILSIPLCVTVIPDHFLLQISEIIMKVWSQFKLKLSQMTDNPSMEAGFNLTEKIDVLELELLKGRKEKIQLPQYKFFHEILERQISAFIVMGVPIKEELRKIKTSLSHDLKVEKEIQDEYIKSIFHFFLVTIITWGMSIFAKMITGHSTPLYISVLIFGLELLGIIIFQTVFKKNRQKNFLKIERLNFQLANAKMVGLTIQSTTELVKLIEKMKPNLSKETEYLIEKYTRIVDKRAMGHAIKDDLDQLISEGWGVYEMQVFKFKQSLSVKRFIVMALFYFSSFSLFILSLLSTFLDS